MILLKENNHSVSELNSLGKLGMEGVQWGHLNLFPVCGHLSSGGGVPKGTQSDTYKSRYREDGHAIRSHLLALLSRARGLCKVGRLQNRDGPIGGHKCMIRHPTNIGLTHPPNIIDVSKKTSPVAIG